MTPMVDLQKENADTNTTEEHRIVKKGTKHQGPKNIDEETQRLTAQRGDDESDSQRPFLKSPCMAAPGYARLQVSSGV